MMGTRKGQFTIPNLVGVVLLLFLFSIMFPVMKTFLLEAASSSGPLLTATLYTIPALILIAILSSPFMLSQIRFEEKMQKRQRQRGRKR